jgi:hypothetical protein
VREILFRGKTDKCEWVQGVPFFKEERCYIIEDLFICDEYDCTGAVNFMVIPETVGQYTGLNDKNGNKIFEGDMLLLDYTGKNLGVNGKAAVLFDNGKFGVLWGWHDEFVCLDGFANTTLEVIGNIHDNSESLKEGEQK